MYKWRQQREKESEVAMMVSRLGLSSGASPSSSGRGSSPIDTRPQGGPSQGGLGPQGVGSGSGGGGAGAGGRAGSAQGHASLEATGSATEAVTRIMRDSHPEHKVTH